MLIWTHKGGQKQRLGSQKPPMTHNIQMEEPRQTSSRVRAARAYPGYLHDVLLNTRGQRGGAFWYSQHAFKS